MPEATSRVWWLFGLQFTPPLMEETLLHFKWVFDHNRLPHLRGVHGERERRDVTEPEQLDGSALLRVQKLERPVGIDERVQRVSSSLPHQHVIRLVLLQDIENHLCAPRQLSHASPFAEDISINHK